MYTERDTKCKHRGGKGIEKSALCQVLKTVDKKTQKVYTSPAGCGREFHRVLLSQVRDVDLDVVLISSVTWSECSGLCTLN